MSRIWFLGSCLQINMAFGAFSGTPPFVVGSKVPASAFERCSFFLRKVLVAKRVGRRYDKTYILFR